MKSIYDIPIRIETATSTDHNVSVDDLRVQLEAARKGKAKVDSKYVGNAEGLNHLFDYQYDYPRFLDNMVHIIKEGKRRKAEKAADLYENPHEMIIQ